MCSAELTLGVAVGDCGDRVSWRGRPLFEGGGKQKDGAAGPRCSKLPRELLLWLWFRFLGARTGQVNVGSQVVIDKQASLAFFWPLSKKDPFLVPRTTLARTIALRACHHPAPTTQHPSPITHGASKISTPLLALLSSIHTASRRTTHSTPLHSIRTRDPLTPLRNHSTSIEQIGESIINCPRPPPPPFPSTLCCRVQ